MGVTEDRFRRLYAAQALRVQGSTLREICGLVSRPEMRSLAGAWPDPVVFPHEEITHIVEQLLEDGGGKVLQYGSTEGVSELRTELALRAREEGNARCQPDDIIVTHGSGQSLDLALRVFVEPGDTVIVGLPSYFGGTGAIAAHGGQLVGIPIDNDGLNTTVLRDELGRLRNDGRRVKGLYVIPNFQNPAGVTLSLERRKDILALAEEFDFMIFEDDPYGEIRFEGDRLPSLKALDRWGRVIHMRSFSKTIAPGLRVGWLSGETAVVGRAVVMKQFVDICTNVLGQHITYEFFRRGWLQKRIPLLVEHYCQKRDFMLDQLEKHFPPEVTWTRPLGGFFIWVRLPEEVDAGDLLVEAIKRRVAFIPGASFFVDGSGQNTLRLSYSQTAESEMEAAVSELGQIIRNRLTHFPRSSR